MGDALSLRQRNLPSTPMPVEIRAVETLHEGFSTVMRATLATSDGETFVREIEDHGRVVAVLPFDPKRKTALLVRLPRASVIWAGGPSALLEAPAGGIEDESAEASAAREALEEVGVRLASLEPVGSVFSTPGVSTERVDLFLAPYGAEDRVAAGGGVAGAHELIDVEEVPLAALWAAVETRRMEDLKTLTLILALRIRRPELFAD